MKCPSCGRFAESSGRFCPYCGKVMPPETSYSPGGPPSPTYAPSSLSSPVAAEPKGVELWARYFAHGALFSLLLIFAALLWLMVTIPLVICGAFIGLFIAILILVLMFGAINTALNTWVWGRSMDQRWVPLFLHGLVVIMVLLAVSIPSFIIQALFPHPAVAILLFLTYCFVDGIIGRWVGGMWMRTPQHLAGSSILGF